MMDDFEFAVENLKKLESKLPEKYHTLFEYMYGGLIEKKNGTLKDEDEIFLFCISVLLGAAANGSKDLMDLSDQIRIFLKLKMEKYESKMPIRQNIYLN